MTYNLRAIASLLAVCIIGVAPGCSTGGRNVGVSPASSLASRTGRGAVKVTIHWPEVAPKSRLIPIASMSIGVTIRNGPDVEGNVTANRPTTGNTSTLIIPDIAAGTYIETASAYPNADASGTIQAQGSQSVVVDEDVTVVTADLVMSSTITTVSITPANPTATVGASPITLNASATDKSGNVVLTAPSNILWYFKPTTTATLAQVGANASITGLAVGTAVVSVKETESGVSSANLSVPITAGVVTPPPTTPNILIADYGNNRIVGLDAIPPTTTVTYNDSISGKPFGGVAGVVRDSSGRIYVGDFYTGIVRIDDFTGKNRVVYAPAGIGVDAIYVDKAGKIYWTDINATINRVDDMTGKNRVTFGNRTTLGYNINSIAVDSSNRVYIFGSQIVRINDITNNDTSSANVTSFGGSGAGINQFAGFGGLAMDSKNRIYVADAGNSRIVRIDDMTGLNWTEFDIPVDAGAVAAPNSVAVDSSATPSIYFLSSTVFRMTDMAGTGLTKLGTLTNGAGALNSPSSLSVK